MGSVLISAPSGLKRPFHHNGRSTARPRAHLADTGAPQDKQLARASFGVGDCAKN